MGFDRDLFESSNHTVALDRDNRLGGRRGWGAYGSYECVDVGKLPIYSKTISVDISLDTSTRERTYRYTIDDVEVMVEVLREFQNSQYIKIEQNQP